MTWIATSTGRFDVRAADPAPKQTDSALDEKRTATEISTKRKLPTSQTVTVKPNASDYEIETRLNKIAASQDVFRRVHVEVTEGIVTVKGEVEEESYAKSFSALSEKVQGVIGVVDQLKVTNVKKTGLRLAQSEIRDLTLKFFRAIPYILSSFVIIGTESGVVHSLNSRCTMLLNSDGILTQIPNATVLAATIKNVSAHTLNRVTFPLQIDRFEELAGFQEVFKQAVQENVKTVSADPSPQAIVSEASARLGLKRKALDFILGDQEQSRSERDLLMDRSREVMDPEEREAGKEMPLKALEMPATR
ncbi:MAG: mechanosensitive ion channel family protein [Cryobacterium sp.]|nr:mechanosensitive ion channel family protein [Oligoflexia bacterium]